MYSRGRNTLSYKIRMWFYRLTLEDVINVIKKIVYYTFNSIMLLLAFLMLFIFPHFFH